MKKSVKATILVSSISTVLFGAALVGHFIYNKEAFEGQKTHETNFYALSAEKMNGVDHHEMPLVQYDQLEIKFEVKQGTFRLSIKDPDQAICFEGDGKEAPIFVLSVPKNGSYAITVQGHHAKGTVQISKRIPPAID